jgi:ABC-type microcin C transport system permease subunit YejE
MIPIALVILLIVCLILFKVNFALMLLVALFGLVGISKLVGKSKYDYIDSFHAVGVFSVIIVVLGGLMGAIFS